MEPVIGVGAQDQLYGRVVRPIRHDRHFKDHEHDKATGKVIKKVHQFCGTMMADDAAMGTLLADFLRLVKFDPSEREFIRVQRKLLDEKIVKELYRDSIYDDAVEMLGDPARLSWDTLMNRVQVLASEYKSAKSIADDPFTFMKKRTPFFKLFAGFSDGEILKDNERLRSTFEFIIQEFSKQDDDFITCDGLVSSERLETSCDVVPPYEIDEISRRSSRSDSEILRRSSTGSSISLEDEAPSKLCKDRVKTVEDFLV
jgi:hypothetical protein